MSSRTQTTEVLLRWKYVRQAVARALYTLEQFTISEAEIFRYTANGTKLPQKWILTRRGSELTSSRNAARTITAFSSRGARLHGEPAESSRVREARQLQGVTACTDNILVVRGRRRQRLFSVTSLPEQTQR